MQAPINEIFYSFQGEGTWTGQPMVFVRFAGCNLTCSFCDQPDSVPLPPTKLAFAKLSTDEIVDIIKDHPTRHVCFTGGEPTLFPDAMKEIIYKLPTGYFFHLETNGTIYLDNFMYQFHHISCAPHIDVDARVLGMAHDIKILMNEQFEYNLRLAHDNRAHYATVWIQPVNQLTFLDDIEVNRVMSFVLANPTFRFSPQLHKLLGVR